MIQNIEISSQSLVNKRIHRSDIDSLRVLATILLTYFHTAMVFNVWDVFHIQNNKLSLEAAIFVSFLNMWHMPLFFFLAGISTYYALDFRSSDKYVKERITRLLIPLIFGMLIVIPPQVYYERLAWWCETRHSPINFNGSYLEFYPQFFIGIYPNGNFSWHHLWFLWYLFFISLISLPFLLKLKKEKSKQKVSKIASFLGRERKIFLFAVPLILINVSLRWAFPESHNFIFDWAAILSFLLIFIFGFIIVADSRLEDSIGHNKKLALFLAIIITVFTLTYDTLTYINSSWNILLANQLNNSIILMILYIIGTSLWAFCVWCWIIVLIGYGSKYLNRPNSFIKYTSEIALPFYILHQTIIVVISFYIIQWDLSILIKFLIITSGSLVITFMLCILVKTNNITRFMFGMKMIKEKK